MGGAEPGRGSAGAEVVFRPGREGEGEGGGKKKGGGARGGWVRAGRSSGGAEEEQPQTARTGARTAALAPKRAVAGLAVDLELAGFFLSVASEPGALRLSAPGFFAVERTLASWLASFKRPNGTRRAVGRGANDMVVLEVCSSVKSCRDSYGNNLDSGYYVCRRIIT